MPFISRTPRPPYFAVIFTSVNADVDHTEHTELYHRIHAIAQTYDGFSGLSRRAIPMARAWPRFIGAIASRSRRLPAIPSTWSPSGKVVTSGIRTT